MTTSTASVRNTMPMPASTNQVALSTGWPAAQLTMTASVSPASTV